MLRLRQNKALQNGGLVNGKRKNNGIIRKMVDAVADEFDLDVAVDFMKRAGFTKEEMEEIGYNLE